MRHELYFSADEVHAALKELGPPGTRGEGTVMAAAQTLASIIEWLEDTEFGEDGSVWWRVEHYLDPAAARQSGRPHVVLERVAEPFGEEEE